MARYFLCIQYLGTSYAGWQSQPNALTVQEEVERALAIFFRQKVPIMASGRTDAGVHARQQWAHFEPPEPPSDYNHLLFKLNAILPKNIAVSALYRVSPQAHARYHATERQYCYRILRRKDPFWRIQAFQFTAPLHLTAMQNAAQTLLGYQDFAAFSKTGGNAQHFFCELRQASFQQNEHLLEFWVSADRFLRGMVRALAGTLLEVGKGRLSEQDIGPILASKNRSQAGPSLPAHGLTLEAVRYPQRIFLD